MAHREVVDGCVGQQCKLRYLGCVLGDDCSLGIGKIPNGKEKAEQA